MILGARFSFLSTLLMAFVSFTFSASPTADLPPLPLNEVSIPNASEVPAKLDDQNPYLKHASLAAFSMSSLAFGGVFYAMQHSVNRTKVGFVGGESASLNSAIGISGLTALVAGVAYFYYSQHDLQQARTWDAEISGDMTPTGEVSLSAILTLPLPFF